MRLEAFIFFCGLLWVGCRSSSQIPLKSGGQSNTSEVKDGSQCANDHTFLQKYGILVERYLQGVDREESTVTNLGVICHNGVSKTPLVSQQIFSTLAHLIVNAQHEVLMQVLEVHPDAEGTDKIIEAILELNTRPLDTFVEPVTIKLLYNRKKLHDPSADLVHELFEESFKDLDPRKVVFEQRQYVAKALGVLHSKSFVVDGSKVIITGANIQSFFDAPPLGQNWTDLGFVFEGNIGNVARDDFFDAWLYALGYNEKTIRSRGLDDLLAVENIEPNPKGPLVLTKANSIETGEYIVDVPVIFWGKRARGNVIAPASNNAPGTRALLTALRMAKRKIKLYTPNFNIPEIKEEIIHAVLRGVKVEILLTKKMNEVLVSLPGQGGTNLNNVKSIMKLLYEKLGEQFKDRMANFDARWFVAENGELAVDGEGRRLLSHAKYYTFDGELAIVGSYNLDLQSQLHSRENGALVLDEEVTRSWDEKIFDPYFARGQIICSEFKESSCF